MQINRHFELRNGVDDSRGRGSLNVSVRSKSEVAALP